ncbi:helix-turn-helix domain-containing protein [Streptomyces sp. N2-109]|uniref:Helix-turn-helix domain-containing protein n=1 Tax=Streptomyces gossypii TaxID=2883101 RepID=A0ABT2JXV6_9ACTN|nr:transcriptional regulator [Streptomyces gossypii]MCT2592715.1 helix-turn-helix domain-containing protein [Streptomyces gossypii]
MSGATGAGGPGEFAELLRGFKDRSGLSYGALAKRLHMSTSTLHRYCNGTVVPNEYGPAERLARVCGATTTELVELHRLWILADAVRGQKPDRAATERPAALAEPDPAASPEAAPGSPPAAGPEAAPGSPPAAGPEAAPGSPPAAGPEAAVPAPGAVPDVDAAPAPGAALDPDAAPAPGADVAPAAGTPVGPGGTGEPLVADRVPGNAARPRRRTVLIASAAVAAVLGVIALATIPSSGGGGGGGDAGDRQAADATTDATGTQGSRAPSASASSSAPSARESGRKRSVPPSASASRTGSGPAADQAGPRASKSGETATGGAAPLSVATRPYVYESPCSQHFLVDSEPEQVGPPAAEPDAPRWAAAYGAVASGEQQVALTLQGTGQDTVVLEALHVRVVSKGAPLAWNDYSMGVGCGGKVDTKSFDVDLDAGSPAAEVKNGQRDFPYKVSETDPEVFYVTAHTNAHEVRWDLRLDWSSGNRRGTLHLDNAGSPFRTSGGTGRPGYDYPNGGDEWIKRES